MDEWEKYYKEECMKLNSQIKLRPGFKEELKVNIKAKLDERERRKEKIRFYLSKVAVVFLSVTIVTTGVFAKDISAWFSNMFKSSDQTINSALEDGTVQYVDMDYIEHDGIGIKVNSILIGDNAMNVEFAIKGEFDGKVNFDKLILKNGETKLKCCYDLNSDNIDKNNHILNIDFWNFENEINSIDNLNIILEKFYAYDTDVVVEKCIEKEWNFNIDIEKNNFENK